VLPFGRLWHDTSDHAIGDAIHSSRSHDVVIRVYDVAGNMDGEAQAAGDCSRAVKKAAERPRRLKYLVSPYITGLTRRLAAEGSRLVFGLRYWTLACWHWVAEP